MKQLVIHVGYPKAASTTLQNGLFLELHRQNAINFLGRAFESSYYGPKQNKGEYKKWFKHVIEASAHNGTDSLGQLQEGTVNCLSEGLFMMNERHCEHIAAPKYLQRHFSEAADEIKIIIIIRTQERLIPSYYVQNYRRIGLKHRNLSDFLDHNIKNNWSNEGKIFNFHGVVRAYADVFQKKNVHILLFEDFLHSRERFSAGLSNALNVDADIIMRKLGEGHLNQTRSEGGTLVVRKFDKDSARYRWFQRLEAIHPSLADKLRIRLPAVSDEQRRAIFDSFKASNLALAEEFSLDKGVMREYGYF